MNRSLSGYGLFNKLRKPVLIGEFPYYRSPADRWKPLLRRMADVGFDVVSFYVPWRLHETGRSETGYEYDFTGITDPRANVRAFIDTALECGLGVLLKPGPFIHAEVQLGGLPDRLCGANCIEPWRGFNGAYRFSQGQRLPSLRSPIAREEVAGWLSTIARELLEPQGSRSPERFAIQIGNEGVLGDLALPLLDDDAAGVSAGSAISYGARVEDSARDFAAQVRWLSEFFPASLTRFLNIPFVRAEAERWAGRTARLARLDDQVTAIHGHTEWIGNASTQKQVLSGHVLQCLALGSSAVEANWGFTWTDTSFATPATPLFHSTLSLLLGGLTVSVYTAISGTSWPDCIQMDRDGLIADGMDPEGHAPPYCPGAPIREDGSDGPTASALRSLVRFLAVHGEKLVRSSLLHDAVLTIDFPKLARVHQERAPDMVLQVMEQLATHYLATGRLVVPKLVQNGSAIFAFQAAGSMVFSSVQELRDILTDASPAWLSGHGGDIALIRRQLPEREGYLVGLFNSAATSQSVRVTVGNASREVRVGAHSFEISQLAAGKWTTLFATGN